MISNCYDVHQVMPQHSRNVPSETSNESRRTTVGKSSSTNTVDRSGPNQKSSGKHKIPKSVRYDLENALVSLCDVWFEEIKPHLVNNNLKLHVYEAGPRPVANASGDFVEQPACSHRDPGAAPDHLQRQNVSCADCCVAQQTASSVQSRKPKVPSRQPALSPLRSMPTSPSGNKQNQLTNSIEKQALPNKPRKKRKLHSHLYKRLSRVGQANNAPSPDKGKGLGDHLDNLYQFFGPRRKLVKKKKTNIANSRMAEASGTPTPVTSVNLSARKPKLCKLTGLRRNKMTSTSPPPLFQDDLLDIIADRMGKKLRLGASSEEPFTMMKLYPYNQKTVGVKKNPPWK